MSTDYSLAVSAPATSAEVADVLARAARHAALTSQPDVPARFGGYGERLASGLLVQVGALQSDPRDPVRQLGFEPSVDVLLSPDKDADTGPQQDDMVRLTSGLLQQINADVVLHRAYEQIWLLRREGRIVVSANDEIWPPERLALLTQPYDRGSPAFDM